MLLTISYSVLLIISILWLLLVLCIICAAAFGKSLGFRRAYIQFVLRLFEYGKTSIENVRQRTHSNSLDSEDEGYEEDLELEYNKNGISSENQYHLIKRDDESILSPEFDLKKKIKNNNETKGTTNKENSNTEINFDIKTWLKVIDYSKNGIEAIIEDQVTSRFEVEELKNWNLLSRTNSGYEFISWKLTALWISGFFIRYCLLLPLRLSIFTFGMSWILTATYIIGKLPDNNFKRWLNHWSYVTAFRVFTRSLSAVINFHNKQWRPRNGSICVANHTSPIDCIILSNDNCYSLIGQKHGGILGVLQKALSRASPHIWFERSEAKDRHLVLQRLKEHTSIPTNPPMLIFPEGTCINNTSVMQFKKGSFEVGCTIYPIAIKYDPRFGNAFWNSSKYSMGHYLLTMMTSWALVCDVWYLPPTSIKSGESSIDFANRVKHLIAQQGGLVDLVWDGQLKRTKPKKEWKEQQQEHLSKLWKGE